MSKVDVRLTQYDAGVLLALKYPLIGIKGNDFGLLATDWGLKAGLDNHNIFISYLTETGVQRFLLFMISLVSVVHYVSMQAVLTEGRRQLAPLGILLGIEGFLACAF